MMWKDKYEIGVERIDSQHKELFDRVSSFISTVQGGGDWQNKQEEVQKTLQFMQEYVVVHFADEEEYQEQINYPDYDAHRQAHEAFKNAVANYTRRFDTEGFKEQLLQEFAGRLMTWLIMHVAAADQKIGEYVRSMGGQGNES